MSETMTDFQATPFEEYRLPPHSTHLRFKAERVDEAALQGTLFAQWDALHARISPYLPFTSPSWNTLWWKHHRSKSLLARDELCLIVVRDARDSLIAVAPLMSTSRPAMGPLRMQSLRYLGADPNVTEIRGMVCEPQHEEAALEAVLNCLKKEYPAADWIEWGALRQSSWEKASRKLPPRTRADNQEILGYHLELPSTWEALRASRSRNIKESIRHCYNSLKRAGLTCELRVVHAPEEVAGALETFFRLHSMRSRATNMVAHGDVFQARTDREFLAAYALDCARRGELRIFQLLIAGSVVATRVAFQRSNQIYLYFSGYDLQWSKYSVMTTLVVEAIKWSIGHRLSILHLSPGTDVSKLRWSPTATRYVASTQVRRRWSAELSYDTYQRAGRLRRRLFGRS